MSEPESESKPVREARLQAILKKWMDAGPLSFFKTLPKQDLIDSGIPMDDLEKHGLISAEVAGEVNIPPQAGKREMCRILTKMFGNGKEIFPEQLTRAIQEGMHGWNKAKSQFVTAQAIQWWRDNKSKSDTQLAEGAAAEAKRKIVALRREEIELAKAERELDATWIKKADAQESVTAAVLQYHALAKRALDKDFAKLVLAKVGEVDEAIKNKIQSAVTDAGREVVAEIEKQSEN